MSFVSLALAHGCLEDVRDGPLPTPVWGWAGAALSRGEGATHFGFVHEGPSLLSCASGTFSLRSGMYFAVPGALSVSGGKGLLVARPGFRGLFHLGGPVEGR